MAINNQLLKKNTDNGVLKIHRTKLDSQDLKILTEYLKVTNIHTLNLSWNNIGEEGIKDLVVHLKGTNITRVIGVSSPELSKTLEDNLKRKKNRIIALAQGLKKNMNYHSS
ncbi:Uncharacterised protein [Legionella londiniensis]|uniref:Uncharacterized protein n=2 Tax=Legionella londiniensis TaxID=45068 RepID=A0A0W0VLQ0_9GAMM|nr:hypothetical protein Llon_1129 [Legionella londiniensis]STX93694.1 Uncharacterised protein [Legionella londiniensis]